MNEEGWHQPLRIQMHTNTKPRRIVSCACTSNKNQIYSDSSVSFFRANFKFSLAFRLKSVNENKTLWCFLFLHVILIANPSTNYDAYFVCLKWNEWRNTKKVQRVQPSIFSSLVDVCRTTCSFKSPKHTNTRQMETRAQHHACRHL